MDLDQKKADNCTRIAKNQLSNKSLRRPSDDFSSFRANKKRERVSSWARCYVLNGGNGKGYSFGVFTDDASGY